MTAKHRCGGCGHLTRSTLPGLSTHGRCPHREGWVRTGDEACEHRDDAGERPVVRVLAVLNLASAAAALGVGLYTWLREGHLLLHALLGGGVLALVALGFLLAGRGSRDENAKYLVFGGEDPAHGGDERNPFSP
jgi:hypothetical protein